MVLVHLTLLIPHYIVHLHFNTLLVILSYNFESGRKIFKSQQFELLHSLNHSQQVLFPYHAVQKGVPRAALSLFPLQKLACMDSSRLAPGNPLSTEFPPP